jgi:hypothetical protein
MNSNISRPSKTKTSLKHLMTMGYSSYFDVPI